MPGCMATRRGDTTDFVRTIVLVIAAAFVVGCPGSGTVTPVDDAGTGGGTGGGSIAEDAGNDAGVDSGVPDAGAPDGGPMKPPSAFVGSTDGLIRVFRVDLDAGPFSPLPPIDGGTRPSFLAISPDHRFLYAANEATTGAVS